MMKIAEIVCTFPPYRGGIGNSVNELSKYLSRVGLDITVFTPNYQDIASEYNATVKVRRLNPFFQFGNAACLPQLFWKIKKFDAVHLHLPFLGSSLPVLFFCWLHPKKKLIVTYHMDLLGKGAKGFIFCLYKKIIAPMVLARANKIVVSSYDYAEHSDIAGYFKKNKKKFAEIPFGVDADRFCPQAKDDNLLEKYFITPAVRGSAFGSEAQARREEPSGSRREDKVLLFVGGLDDAHSFKGLDVLLRAVKNLSGEGSENLKLIVVGDGEKKSDFQNMAESFNIARNVIFAGGVPDAELPAHYNLADVFVFPSVNKSEAFGLVLLEAASCGKPLVASNLSGVRTIVEEGKTGFLSVPGDAKDLAEKIKAVIFNDGLVIEMGKNNRKKIEENYRWENVAEKYKKILES